MQTATAMDVTPATVNQTGEVLLTMSAEAPSLTHKEAAASLALGIGIQNFPVRAEMQHTHTRTATSTHF